MLAASFASGPYLTEEQKTSRAAVGLATETGIAAAKEPVAWAPRVVEQYAPENDIFAGIGTPVEEDWKPLGLLEPAAIDNTAVAESGQPREHYTVESTHLAVGYSTVVVDCFELPAGADNE